MIDGINKYLLMAVADIIKSRNGRGYKVKIGEEWYEVASYPCEPPDTAGDCVDAEPY